jgi:Putative adhesin
MQPMLMIKPRHSLAAWSAGLILFAASTAIAGAPEHQERHFTVQGRPIVVLQNVVNGRIEVKSWQNSEVVVSSTAAKDKVDIDMEQVGDRIDISATAASDSPNGQPHEIEANFQLTVPEHTELQLKTQTGLIYVEQVTGDMKLESIAGDVHLKEVSGYIIVKTTGGSFVCTLCSGKLEFSSVSGSAQLLQPQFTNVNLITTSGNILYDGDFMRTGIYTMKSGKGLVEVRFSGNDSFDLEAKTYSGIVDNQAAQFMQPEQHTSRHGNKFTRYLNRTVGLGFAKVEISTYTGTIRILKRD